MTIIDLRAGALRGVGLAAGLLLLSACGPSFNFVHMAKDSGGDEKTTSFYSTGDEIHCVMEVVGGDEETVVRLELTGDGELNLDSSEHYPRPDPKVTKPVILDIQLFGIDQDGKRQFKGPWPTGSYNMDVFLEDDLEESLPFTITD